MLLLIRPSSFDQDQLSSFAVMPAPKRPAGAAMDASQTAPPVPTWAPAPGGIESALLVTWQ